MALTVRHVVDPGAADTGVRYRMSDIVEGRVLGRVPLSRDRFRASGYDDAHSRNVRVVSEWCPSEGQGIYGELPH